MINIIRKSTAASLAALACAASANEIRIATVNNQDMLRVQELSRHFLADNPGTTIHWTVLDETTLRIRLNRDSKRAVSDYDIYTLGYLQAFNWSKSNRLDPAPDPIVRTLQSDNFIESITNGFRFDETFYGMPFYGESSITYYRKDRLAEYGLSLSSEPTWSEIDEALAELTRLSFGKYGHVCLRGKAGWGENVALMTTIANSFGGRWFNEEWQADVSSDAWFDAISHYLKLQKNYGLPEAWQNGYNQNLTAFTQGNCDIWVDSTAAGSSVSAALSEQQVGFAYAPYQHSKQGSSWLWSWGFGVSSTSPAKADAWRFIQWATSEQYQRLVEQEYGIGAVPPGTRESLYGNPSYQSWAPYAGVTIQSIEKSDMQNPSTLPTPYQGIQFVQTPEFEQTGQFLAKRLSEAVKVMANGQEYDVRRLQREVTDFANAAHRVATYMDRKK